MKKKENEKYYILYVKQWIYDIYNIDDSGNLVFYNKSINIMLNEKYVTIVKTNDKKIFKDLIYKGRKYKLDLNVGFGHLREVVYLEEIKDFNIKDNKKEQLEYLKNYIEDNKEKIEYTLNNNKVYEPTDLIAKKRRK